MLEGEVESTTIISLTLTFLPPNNPITPKIIGVFSTKIGMKVEISEGVMPKTILSASCHFLLKIAHTAPMIYDSVGNFCLSMSCTILSLLIVKFVLEEKKCEGKSNNKTLLIKAKTLSDSFLDVQF